MGSLERRFKANQTAKCEVRTVGEVRAITGYAAVFYREADPGTEYQMWEDFTERIQPGAFDRAIAERHDARGLYNHDTANLLGRVSNGTVKLTVDKVGLRFEIPIDDNDPDHQRVVAKVERGDLTGCSFAFANATSEWEERTEGEKTVHVRNISDLDLFDVGPVTHPAYEATACGVRTSVLSVDDLIEAQSILTAHRYARDEHLAAKKQRYADELEVETTWQTINAQF